MKHFFCATLALLLVLCVALTGCGPASPAPDPSGSIIITDPDVDTRISLSAPLVTLSCYDGVTSSPSYIDLGGGKVFVIYYTQADSVYTSHLQILDIPNDTVCASTTMSGMIDLPRQSASSSLWVSDGYRHCFYRLDDALTVQQTLPVPTTYNGTFSADGSQYYFEENGYLFSLDIQTEAITHHPLPHNLKFSMLDGCSSSNFLHGSVYCEDGPKATAVLDPSTNEFVLLSHAVDFMSMCGDRFFGGSFASYTENARLLQGALSQPVLRYIDTGDESYSYYFISGSPYLMGSATDYVPGEDLGDSLRLARVDDTGVVCCSLRETVGLTDMTNPRYLPSEDWIIGTRVHDGRFDLVVLDLTQVPFNDTLPSHTEELPSWIDASLWEDYEHHGDIPSITDRTLDSVRATADDLEERYGIRILFSDQCESFTDSLGYSFETTAETDFYESEADRIAHSLDQLETALSRYPDGFFRQFRTRIGTGGVQVLMTGSIQGNEYSVGGFTSVRGEWYHVVLDISSSDITSSYHHEFWHAIEERLYLIDPPWLATAVWSVNNPAGFEYDVSNYLKHRYFEYTFYGAENYTASFVDDYGMVNPKEDRARLFEAIMSPANYSSAEIVRSPHLRNKLSMMADSMRQAFDTSSWSTPYWERFF